MYLSCSYSWRLIYLAACLNCELELLQSIWSALTRFLVECRHPNSLIGWNSLSICRIPRSSPRLLLLAYWENEILEVNAAVNELSSEAGLQQQTLIFLAPARQRQRPRITSFSTPSIGSSPTDISSRFPYSRSGAESAGRRNGWFRHKLSIHIIFIYFLLSKV